MKITKATRELEFTHGESIGEIGTQVRGLLAEGFNALVDTVFESGTPPSSWEDDTLFLSLNIFVERQKASIRFVLQSDIDYQNIEQENLALMNKISEIWQKAGKSSKK